MIKNMEKMLHFEEVDKIEMLYRVNKWLFFGQELIESY